MYYWTNELWRLSYLVIGLGLLGWVLGAPGWGLAGGLGLFVLIHLRHLRELYVWLTHHPSHEPPIGTGVWGDLFDRLYKYQKGQRQAQARLRDIVRRVQDSAEAMRDSVVMLDNRGDLEWWNSAAEGMLGLQATHDRGQHITNLLRDPRFVAYFNARDYREPLTLPSPLRDDLILQFQITLYGDDERLVMARDITRLHRLEQMRRDFVANVSHELRTPLTVLAGYLETYGEQVDQLPPRWQRGINQMQEQTTRMQNLVDDLLLLSRLETDHRAEQAEPVAIDALLASIRDDAESLSGGRHTLRVDIEEPRGVSGIETEIRSAVSNLVFNAVRYAGDDATIVMRWRAWPDGTAQRGAALEVKDDGEGIDPVHLPRLTERFYRVDKGRSAASGGTGLGLAIVKHVLLRHDARLEIESRPGEGALFRCVFPAARLLDGATQASSERSASAAGSGQLPQ